MDRKSYYCYPGSDVLKNLLNITDFNNLIDVERALVMYRTSELISNPIKGNFDFDYLKNIHKYLFQDIYEWAGTARRCNIAKESLFCLCEYIENYAKNIFDELKEEKYYLDLLEEEKINRLVNLFADINALHPFREGNGRTQRIFIENLARINGIDLDLTGVSKDDMISASYDSINGNNEKLMNIFKNNYRVVSKDEQLFYVNLYASESVKRVFN